MSIVGMDYLRSKLAKKENRVNLRYAYYDAKNKVQEVSKLIPDEFKTLSYAFGWSATACDQLADRIIFDGFDNDLLYLDEIYSMNNSDILFDGAILSAIITSCSFLYIDVDDSGYPVIQCIDGGNATGELDTTTQMLKYGYAVLERDSDGRIMRQAYFKPFSTEYYDGDDNLIDTFEHKAPYPLLVPVIFRPDAKRPFGHSRISRACMALQQTAMRTMLRTEVAAEFYSVPQKYVVGLAKNAEFNGQKATYSSFLQFGKDAQGEMPKLGQFDQHSMEPHIEHMRMLASMFAGETGLTLDDLGFQTDNPSSSDAIKAAHENLRLTARRAQRTFGVGFKNAGYLAACLRDDKTYARTAIRDTKVLYAPLFEPDISSLGAIGDAVYKFNEAVPGFFGAKAIRQITGFEGEST